MTTLTLTKSDSRSLGSMVVEVAAAIRNALTPMEDEWTWTTREGACYEQATVVSIESGEIILRHSLGEARVPVSALSDESRRQLERMHGVPFHPDEAEAVKPSPQS